MVACGIAKQEKRTEERRTEERRTEERRSIVGHVVAITWAWHSSENCSQHRKVLCLNCCYFCVLIVCVRVCVSSEVKEAALSTSGWFCAADWLPTDCATCVPHGPMYCVAPISRMHLLALTLTRRQRLDGLLAADCTLPKK